MRDTTMKQSPELSYNRAQEAITIVLADDHTMMREGTRRLLEEDPVFMVVGEAGDGELC